MPYQSEDDPVVETLNSMVWGIIGLFAGILAALGIFAWQKYTAPKLPDSLEGRLRTDHSVDLWAITSKGRLSSR